MMALLRRLFGIAIITVSTALAGCAGLSTPYVEIERPAAAVEREDVTLAYGIAYAQQARAAYRAKLSEHARIGTDGGAALITLAAIVLGLAAFDAHTDMITGAALAGGTGYAIGNWYANDAHQLTYLAGMEATSCAVEAVLPLYFSPTARDALAKDLGDLGAASSELGSAMSAVQSLIPLVEAQAGGETDLTRKARTDVTEAGRILEQADKAYAAGRVLLRNIDAAGARLVTAIDRINVAMDRALQQTNPRLESLTNVISQLSASSALFAPGLDISGMLTSALAPKDTVGGPQSGGAIVDPALAAQNDAVKLAQALGRLAVAAGRAASLSRQVAAQVKAVNDARPLQALKDCGVDVEQIPSELTLSTGSISFDAKKASSQLVLVSGGKKPYVARFLQSPTPGLDLRNPLPGDSAVEIVASSQSEAGQFQILIADAAAHRATLVVLVRGEATVPRDTADNQTPKLTTAAQEIRGKNIRIGGVVYDVTDAEVVDTDPKTLKVVLVGDPPPDGVAAAAEIVVHDAIKSLGIPRERVIVEPQPAPQSGGAIRTASRWGTVVDELSAREVTSIQKALCFSDEGVDAHWGKFTQARLEYWRGHAAGNVAPTRVAGNLTDKEAAALLKMDGAATASLCSTPWWR